MSAYLQNLLTHTTSKYASIRRNLLSSEDDGDTEDDSHITRALRAYYVEKGRPFPPWLPPDPKEVARQQSQTSTASAGYVGQVNAYLGRNNSSAPSAQQPTGMPGGGRQGGGLSDLWGDSGSGGGAAPAQSLRNSRRQGQVGGGLQPPAPQQQQPSYMSARAMEQNSSTSSLGGPRPLPSQRAGSYQSVGQDGRRQGGSGVQAPVSSGVGGSSSAQDRLKARLWGGGGSQPGSGRNSPQPPGQPQQQYGNPYDRR